MSILNRPSDGLLTVLLALCRAILAEGPQSETRLVTLCAPPAVSDGDMVRKTLTRWKQLGMFSVRGNLVHLHPEITGLKPDDLDGLRGAVLRLVLAPENNPDSILSGDSRSGDEASLAGDFTRAASWALAQDIYRFRTRWEELQGEQAITPAPFANDTRWSGFVEWATFLGIALKHRGGLMFDPAFAIQAVFPLVFDATREFSASTFIQRLSSALPVVDGGPYRVLVEGTIRKPWRVFGSHELSPSLSAALLHLDAAGELRLEIRADAPRRMLTGRGGEEHQPFTHVVAKTL